MPRKLKHILCVDDDDSIREVVELALSVDRRITVRTCASGLAALDELRSRPADLVLLDAVMPGLDGPATLERIRAEPVLASVTVAFLTAKALPDEIERLLALGAIGVITKPFDPRRLPGDIRKLWNRSPHRRRASDDELTVELEAVYREFRERLTEEAARCASLENKLSEATAKDLLEATNEIRMLAHRLRGTAPSFGVPAVGDAAGTVEDEACVLLASKQQLAEPSVERLRDALMKLRSVCGGH